MEPAIVDGEVTLEPAICTAVRSGDVCRLNGRLSRGGWADCVTADGTLVLVLAAQLGRADCVAALLAWGAGVDKTSAWGPHADRTALLAVSHWWCVRGS